MIREGETELGGKHRELSEIIVIETTTSWYARFKVEGNRFGRKPEEEGEKKQMKRSRTMSERDSRTSWFTKTVFSNDKPPSYIYISFWERSWSNIMCRIIYSLARCFNVVLMFYFAP